MQFYFCQGNDRQTCHKPKTSYLVEYLNFIESSEIPSYKLRLKIGVSLLLMRNLEAWKLCNGTELQIKHLRRNIVGNNYDSNSKRENVIPRMPIIPTDLPSYCKRLQFPLKVGFARIINNTQKQTLKEARLNLETKIRKKRFFAAGKCM